VVIEQSMADETIHYIPRDGLYWNIPELGIQTQHSYSYNRPSTGKIFNFLKSCGKDIKIYALTETQIDRLKKKGFELNSLGEDLVDLLEAAVSTLEKDDVKFYYDQVVKSNHLEEWRETLLKAKGKDNETFVDFLLTDYLQNKLSSTNFFDSKKVEKYKNISSFADLLSTGHLFKNRLADFWKRVEVEQAKIQATAPSGDLLVEKMVQAIPPLLHWNNRLYYAKNMLADKRNFIELLNFLNKVEAHKKL
jgi:DNA-binding PadR family transcriptional regulator